MLSFKTQGFIGHLADKMMIPLMYVLQGTTREVPQRTHWWNNKKFRSYYESRLIKKMNRVSFSGDSSARRRWLGPIPLFHMKIFGGWKKFVVLEPKESVKMWHVGWFPTDGASPGVSRITLSGRVRVTIGYNEVSFFGVTRFGEPVELHCVGEGYIGKAGEFADIPLL